MIEEQKVYEFLTSQVAARATESVSAFKMFRQLFSAIVGGAIWLSLQPSIHAAARSRYALLSDIAVSITAFVVVALVVDNLRSWHSYRRDVAQLGRGVGFAHPKFFPSAISEMAMLASIVAATSTFWIFNPFLLT